MYGVWCRCKWRRWVCLFIWCMVYVYVYACAGVVGGGMCAYVHVLMILVVGVIVVVGGGYGGVSAEC